MTIVSHAVLVRVSAPLRQFLRVISILSTPISALSAEHAQAFVRQRLSAWANCLSVRHGGAAYSVAPSFFLYRQYDETTISPVPLCGRPRGRLYLHPEQRDRLSGFCRAAEPLPCYAAVPAAASGCGCWCAGLCGHLVHGVPFPSLAGSAAAHAVVCPADVAGVQGLQGACGLEPPVADTPGCSAAHRLHSGLLGLYLQDARLLLRCRHRILAGSGSLVGLQSPQALVAQARHDGPCRYSALSPGRMLRPLGSGADGFGRMALGQELAAEGRHLGTGPRPHHRRACHLLRAVVYHDSPC